MFCKNCGQNLADNARFCPICGTTVSSQTQPDPQPQPQAQPNPYAPNPELSALSNSAFIWGIVSLGLCVVGGLIGCILGAIFSRTAKAKVREFEAKAGVSAYGKANVGKILATIALPYGIVNACWIGLFAIVYCFVYLEIFAQFFHAF